MQIVDAAFAEVARKSGSWLPCRPGCTQCCTGTFAINQLDAARLRRGMTDLGTHSPERAAAVRERARMSIQRMAAEFPGDLRTVCFMRTRNQSDDLRTLLTMSLAPRSTR
jgi:hypothetical protein